MGGQGVKLLKVPKQEVEVAVTVNKGRCKTQLLLHASERASERPRAPFVSEAARVAFIFYTSQDFPSALAAANLRRSLAFH